MFHTSVLMKNKGVQAVFTNREGGCSPPPFGALNLGFDLGDADKHVRANLQTLCQASGLSMPHQAQQVHGHAVLVCTGAGKHHDVEADILLSTEPKQALAVRTADCLPLLLADPQAQVIAAVHAGWRGTVAQVASIAVQAMLDAGAQAERILASLGPCIGACCFEVNADIKAKLQDCCGHEVSAQRDGNVYADLALANYYQLLNSGLSAENMERLDACTACSKQPPYFSYRRDAGQTGRQLALIALEGSFE